MAKKKPVAGGKLRAPDSRRKKLQGKRFVLTSAQNNTYVNEKFWESLLKYVEHNDAKLLVSTFTYNKDAFENSQKDDEELWYDDRIKPYITNESLQIADGLVFCAELNILPTAENPLSGFDNYSRSASSVIPHAKMAMKSVPRMRDDPPRFLYTTGACTKRNYIQKKAGQKAEFHHVFGALVVEIDNQGVWFVRQLIAGRDGSFYDLDKLYTPEGVSEGQTIEGLQYGDIHIEKVDPIVAEASWLGEDSLLKVLKPKFQFVHDLIDFEARNHHNIKDPFFLANQHHNRTNSVETGIIQSGHFLMQISSPNVKTIVVASNHHDALDRWLREARIEHDPENAIFYHECCLEMHRRIIRRDTSFNVFEWAVRKHYNKAKLPNVKFLRDDDSFVIAGDIECGMHGHLGPNGSRGAPRNLRCIGKKANTGHTHAAGIIDGVYTAGVSATLDMGYNKGPTSWSHSHIITYQNGKRAIITIKQGKWRA